MSDKDKEESEVERSVKVAQEKVAHWEIELVEKKRKFFDTLSIARRVTDLMKNIANHSKVFEQLYGPKLPEEGWVYSEICETLNGWIRVYNSIHHDVKYTYGLGEKFDEMFPLFEEVPPLKSQILKRNKELMMWTLQLLDFLDRKLRF